MDAGCEVRSGHARDAKQYAARCPKYAVDVEGSEAGTMAEILATKTSLPGRERPGMFESVQAEALFASTLQPSASPSSEQVRWAIARTLRRRGIRGCAAQVANEFGDHPDTAVTRMRWALATIHTVYPALSAPSPRPPSFASLSPGHRLT